MNEFFENSVEIGGGVISRGFGNILISRIRICGKIILCGFNSYFVYILSDRKPRLQFEIFAYIIACKHKMLCDIING